MFAETATGLGFEVPVEEPDVGLMLSQEPVADEAEAVQIRVPPPEFQTERVPEFGFDPPTSALKDMDEVSTPILGVVLTPVSVRVTETVCGELEAPGAERVIVSV